MRRRSVIIVIREKEVEHHLRTDISKEDLLLGLADIKTVEEVAETDREDEALSARRPSTDVVLKDLPHPPLLRQATLPIVLRAHADPLQADLLHHCPLKAPND